jgi:GntR family transcriptional regulator
MYARSLRDHFDPMPLYGRIAAVVRSQVLDGTWQPGDALPPIETLCRTYGVARVTVRQAIALLVEEGLLVSRRGSRVTVAGAKSASARERLYQTLDVMNVLAPGHIIDVLEKNVVAELPPGACFVGTPAASYVCYRKTHSDPETPYCAMTIYVAQAIVDRFPSGAENHAKLGSLVRRYAEPPLAYGRERTTVAAADYRDAELLRYPVAAPVARMHRVFCDADDCAAYVGFATYRGDRWGVEQDSTPYEKHRWEFQPTPVEANANDDASVGDIRKARL